MIKQIRITNFCSFHESEIDLDPNVNILIGINGSGKSNFLKAVKLLREGVSGIGLQKHLIDNLGGFDNVFFKGSNSHHLTDAISIRYTFDGDAITNGKYGFKFTDDILYTITLTRSPSLQNFNVHEKIESQRGYIYLDFTNGVGHLAEKSDPGEKPKLIRYSDYDPQGLVLKEVSDSDRYYALTTLRKAIRDVMVYDYFDTTPKSPIRKAVLATSDKRLASDGTNLPQILNTIKINYKQQYRKIVEMLNEVNPNFTGFDFNFISGNSSIELMLEEHGLDSSVHVSGISDGTLRYLCLLAILYNPDRGSFICIDEPEVGLHPDMILNVANAVKEASEKSAMVISTHSENLLNYFDLQNVRVFDKDDTNASNVISYDAANFNGWYEQFSLGHMWKQGDLGGVRYGA
ncbi:DNA replication and repair protein RecF [Dyadobacter sp. CECT 9275]|uniref:DNA replication and repair protein RecF n=1 Tax=Dyadobacter helix TaxID=2822344 RepID=A0A916N5P9_9BACT|nr:AAA family ATPase [Dyadobacter sp. CECT 9275]CAG5006259.1 DNA replication and repair protein RecF [Dyadobacter sp. CECT 9275]